MTASNGDKARRLTSGAWSVAVTLPPGPPSPPLSWSPDGQSIAFVKQATPHSGDTNQRSMQILDVASGAMRGLTGINERESQPVFSPDGAHIAYWYVVVNK